MSSKKDKINSDKLFMSTAMNLALSRNDLTGLNPSVGCLIVKNNRIISFGQTGINGRPHAELVAIKKCKKKDLKDSTIYITMEPCTHYGKTPPCTELIIKSKIKRVVYSTNDIDIRTKNKAYSLLKSKNIKISKGLLIGSANNIYRRYFFHKKNKMPYIIAKIACSKDYYTSTADKFITNSHSRKLSHLLRFKSDSILTTSKTINIDNPILNCRINGLGQFSPKRLILDKELKINKKAKIINDKNYKNVIIFHSSKNINKINFFKSKGIRLIYITLDNKNQINLKKVFSEVYKNEIGSIIIEGGKLLTENLIKNKLINEFYLFKSNQKLGKLGNNKINSIENKLSIIFKNKKKIETFLDDNQLTKYY
tara:strand:- start:3456 stop:4556 length:1101 start_codon:yes stop_codon:yes gene_type:complete